MALSKCATLRSGLNLDNIYIRIEEVRGNKNDIYVLANAYVSKDGFLQGNNYLEQNAYIFTPNVEDTASNFIKQGYEYLKTLEEYKDSVDC